LIPRRSVHPFQSGRFFVNPGDIAD
jgi:hypothetical protein